MIMFLFLCLNLTCDAQKLPMPVGTGNILTPVWGFNPSYSGTSSYVVISSGGLNVQWQTSTNQYVTVATSSSLTGKSSGKYYWEIYIAYGGANMNIGVISGLTVASSYQEYLGADPNGFAYFSTSGGWWAQGTNTFNACGSTYWSVTGNTIGIALNATSNQISIYLNNSLQCTQTISGGNYFPAMSSTFGSGANTQLIAHFTSASWTYSAPSGYGALN